MSELTGNSSRSHESSVNLFYGELIAAWNSLDTPAKKQLLLNELTNTEYITQVAPLVANVSFPETVSLLEADTKAQEDNLKTVFRIFGCWLFALGKSWGATMNYLSAFKNIVSQEVLPNESFFSYKHKTWYTNMRGNIRKAFMKWSQITGIRG
jgi:hypothetical protein